MLEEISSKIVEQNLFQIEPRLRECSASTGEIRASAFVAADWMTTVQYLAVECVSGFEADKAVVL